MTNAIITTDTRHMIVDMIGTAAHKDYPDDMWRIATEAMALAQFAGFDLLVEECEGLRERAGHDMNCKVCSSDIEGPEAEEYKTFWCSQS